MNILKNKTILVTGGTGSFGSAFIGHILNPKYKVKKIIIFSRDELKQFQLKNKLNDNKNILRFFLGDVRDKERLSLLWMLIWWFMQALKQVLARIIH